MWEQIEQRIVSCQRCERLVRHRVEVAQRIPPRFSGWSYWARGVPGFGDREARLWIIGLAPAAHGANRTGRMFTGDSSGEWLYRALYETGFANQATSTHRDDGLRLCGAFISAAVRCVPPQNRPTSSELRACLPYLISEWQLLKPTVRVIVALGEVAYQQVQRLFAPQKGPPFRHGATWPIEGVRVLCSYHPSRQNTQTRRLSWAAWLAIFAQARTWCDTP